MNRADHALKRLRVASGISSPLSIGARLVGGRNNSVFEVPRGPRVTRRRLDGEKHKDDLSGVACAPIMSARHYRPRDRCWKLDRAA